ncbi:hypothetical protein Q4490_02780 [Neptunomonas phycophila]|uniref:Uncharacterized protein n=1 Tax=Neptunomonas phycophila TaxID=1572645 RepID=A0AAW7XE77_9GAMM|nr:hypothetical protein [Neptunomonas phycophila]MDO6452481.1 hypothetical protein [Neptunomonas phycophila]
MPVSDAKHQKHYRDHMEAEGVNHYQVIVLHSESRPPSLISQKSELFTQLVD